MAILKLSNDVYSWMFGYIFSSVYTQKWKLIESSGSSVQLYEPMAEVLNFHLYLNTPILNSLKALFGWWVHFSM